MRPLFLSLLTCALAWGESAPRRLTLAEAVDLALKQNSLLRLARLKVEENQSKARAARSHYLPQLTNETNYWELLERQRVVIPAGVIGMFKDEGPVPSSPITIEQGSSGLLFATTTLGQPLTQLWKIRQGHQIARLDRSLAENSLSQAENQVAYHVHELFFGLLIAGRQREAARLRVSAAEERLREGREAVETGQALEVAVLGGRAALLESRHALLALENQVSDLCLELNDLLGLPLDTRLEPASPAPAPREAPPLEQTLEAALAGSREIRAAEQTVEKARRGVRAAQAEFIPEISAFSQHVYQSGVPFLASNNGIVGLKMNWNVFDGGRRGQVVAERRSLAAQAEESLRRARNRVRVEVEKAQRKLERSLAMVDVAAQALELRREAARLAQEQVDAGLATASKLREAQADLAKAESDALAADLGCRLARAELDRLAGRTPKGGG